MAKGATHGQAAAPSPMVAAADHEGALALRQDRLGRDRTLPALTAFETMDSGVYIASPQGWDAPVALEIARCGQGSAQMPDFHLFSSGPRPVAPFSHAVEADGWVILTGQMPTDPDAPDAPLPDGIVAQTQRVMDNLALILEELSLDLSHVLQCRCFLTEFERDYAAFNETYAGYFPTDRRPARTTIGVTALAVGALVEIDCVARRP